MFRLSIEGMNLSGSLRVNNEKTKKEGVARVFPYLSAFTRSHVRDPNRCTLSLRLRLGTATTRDNKRKRMREHGALCAVAARGFKFDLSLFYLASRVEFLFPFATILAFPRLSAFFLKASSIRLNQMDRRVDNEKKKKKKSHTEKIPGYRLTEF